MALLIIYGGARVLQVFPHGVPMPAIVALHVIPPALFALIHGAVCYGMRRGIAFIAICLAYLAWTLARLIVGSRLIALPVVAACLMVSWDLSMEPIWATVVRAWIWTGGGDYFGVPLSNFFGWFLTVFVFYQVFAIYLIRDRMETRLIEPIYWRQAVLFYAVSAAANLLFLIPTSGPAADAAAFLPAFFPALEGPIMSSGIGICFLLAEPKGQTSRILSSSSRTSSAYSGIRKNGVVFVPGFST